MTFLKVAINQTLLSQDIVNVLCFTGSGAVPANGQAITDWLESNYQDELSPMQSTNYSFDSCTFYDAAAAAGTPGLTYIPTGGGYSGVSSHPPVPTQVAALVAFYSITGPPWRGRAYVAGLTDFNMGTDGKWLPAALTELQQWGDAFFSIGIDTGLVVQHAIIGGNAAIPLADRTGIINSYAPRSIPATQRRRRIGVGS